MTFKDRHEAGELLAEKLYSYRKKNAIVLGIPRGGVVVAYEIARKLKLPLDIIVIKKIGYPGDEEFAIGAAGVNDYYINSESTRLVSDDYIKEQIKIRQEEAKKKYTLLKGSKRMAELKGKIVILVDDGIATGATMKMATEIISKKEPEKIIIAVPVASPDTIKELEKTSKVITLEQPENFMAIGQFYNKFDQTEDSEVKMLLLKSKSKQEK